MTLNNCVGFRPFYLEGYFSKLTPRLFVWFGNKTMAVFVYRPNWFQYNLLSLTIRPRIIWLTFILLRLDAWADAMTLRSCNWSKYGYFDAQENMESQAALPSHFQLNDY